MATLIYSPNGVFEGYGPSPSPTVAPTEVIGRSSSPFTGSSGSLFSVKKNFGSCASCSSTEGDSSSSADIFSPEGRTKLCGKCLCTWLLAGLLLVALILWANDDDDDRNE